jgi:hypothetical protein
LVEFFGEQLDALDRGNGVGQERGVVLFEDNGLADVLVEERRNLRKEFVDAQELELEELGHDLTTRGKVERGTLDNLRAFEAYVLQRDDLQEFIAHAHKTDLVKIEQCLECAQRFRLCQRLLGRERERGRG